MTTLQPKRSLTLWLTTCAVLSAIATILYFIETPLFLLPDFLKLDISNIPALIGGFALGPIGGVAIVLVKNLIHLLFTKTAGVGELADFVISGIFILASSVIYMRIKSRKGAMWGMVLGTFLMSFVAGPLMNYFVLLPFYAKFQGWPLQAVIGYSAKFNKSINSLWTYLIYAIVPFNLIKCILAGFLTALLYKPLSPILHRYKKY